MSTRLHYYIGPYITVRDRDLFHRTIDMSEWEKVVVDYRQNMGDEPAIITNFGEIGLYLDEDIYHCEDLSDLSIHREVEALRIATESFCEQLTSHSIEHDFHWGVVPGVF